MNPHVVDAPEMSQFNELAVAICLHAESDEQWSYVQNKSNQRWLWYVRERFSGRILADTLGKRTDETFRELKDSIAHLPIKYYDTDNWGGYHRE